MSRKESARNAIWAGRARATAAVNSCKARVSEARRLARIYDRANIAGTKALYDDANAFDKEMRAFGDQSKRDFPGGRTRRDELNIEISHGL